jgi:small GTP-binding protein
MSTQYKVVLLGEGRVGKTSLVNRFINNEFDDKQASTVTANMYCKKKIEVAGKSIDLNVWDTAGQERFHALGPIYYRNADGAVLVYDITDPDTFDKVKSWIRELKKVVGESIQIVICGNKGDLEKDRKVSVAMAEELAKAQGAVHFTTSAKTSMKVTEAFSSLAQLIIKADPLAGSSSKPPARASRGKGLKIAMEPASASPSGQGPQNGSPAGNPPPKKGCPCS